jgi:hypothetical protein
MDLVLNEWVPEYFRPDTPQDKRRQLERFLNSFMNSDDKLIVRRPSPFLEKIERYAKANQHRSEVVEPIRVFIKHILQNIDRCEFVDDDQPIILPELVEEKLSPGNFSSDRYLFEAASCIGSQKTIVTTDKKLVNQFSDVSWCRLILLSDFLDQFYPE